MVIEGETAHFVYMHTNRYESESPNRHVLPKSAGYQSTGAGSLYNV